MPGVDEGPHPRGLGLTPVLCRQQVLALDLKWPHAAPACLRLDRVVGVVRRGLRGVVVVQWIAGHVVYLPSAFATANAGKA
jgi:hypothetical protein